MTLIYTVTILSSFLVSFLCHTYFYALAFNKGTPSKGSIFIYRILCSIINGLISGLCINLKIYGLNVLVSSFLITLEFYIMTKNKAKFDFYFYFSLGLAAVLSLLGTALVGFISIHLYPLITFSENSIPYHGLVSIFSSLLGSLMLLLLLFTEIIPSRPISTLLKHPGNRKMILAYMLAFSLAILASLDGFSPKIFNNTLPNSIRSTVAIDSIIRTLVMVSGGYIIIVHLSKFEAIKMEAQAISSDIRRKQYLRQNIFSDIIISFCANITKNTIEEGLDFLRVGMDEAQPITFLSMSKALIETCVHPSDKMKLLPFLDTNVNSSVFKGFITKTEKVRLSRNMLVASGIDLNSATSGNYSDEWLWTEIRITKTEDIDSKETFLYVGIRNIDSEVADHEALRQMADRDTLTGVYNRSAFNRIVKGYLNSDHKDGVLYIIDMDFFKSINDNLGHPEGDRHLIEIACLLKEEFRNDDIVARIGGDEFAVFSIGLRGFDTIIKRAEAINKKAIKAYKNKDGLEFTTSLSIGIAVSPIHGEGFEALYQNSDLALYHAKEAGRNRFFIYSDELRKKPNQKNRVD